VGVALGAVANDGKVLPFRRLEVGVGVVEELGHPADRAGQEADPTVGPIRPQAFAGVAR